MMQPKMLDGLSTMTIT